MQIGRYKKVVKLTTVFLLLLSISLFVDSRELKPHCRVVTGKFVHENVVVLDLVFDNDSKNRLGITPNYPLWSKTRNDWVKAGQLRIGEFVQTKNGIAQLTMRSQRLGHHKVCNLEVHKDHTYYVSNLGVLAHNSCAILSNPFRGADAPKQAFKHFQKYHTIDLKIASNRLYKLKSQGGLGAADDVIIGRAGDVYNAGTVERIGNLTYKTLRMER